MSDEKTGKQADQEEQTKTSPEEISEQEAEDIAGGGDYSWLHEAEQNYTGGGAGRHGH